MEWHSENGMRTSYARRKRLLKGAPQKNRWVDFLEFIRPFPHRRVVTFPARVSPRLWIFSGMGSCVQGMFCGDRCQAVSLSKPIGRRSSCLKKSIFNLVVTFHCSAFVEIHCDLLNFKPVKVGSNPQILLRSLKRACGNRRSAPLYHHPPLATQGNTLGNSLDRHERIREVSPTSRAPLRMHWSATTRERRYARPGSRPCIRESRRTIHWPATCWQRSVQSPIRTQRRQGCWSTFCG